LIHTSFCLYLLFYTDSEVIYISTDDESSGKKKKPQHSEPTSVYLTKNQLQSILSTMNEASLEKSVSNLQGSDFLYYHLKVSDFLTLKPCQWLNDEV
jgi:hypothetical protein